MPKGTSAREKCPVDILMVLSKKEKGFEELVKCIPYSRGTVNKYLDELFNEGKIKRNGRRGKYRLTFKGEMEAKREQSLALFNELTLGLMDGLEKAIRESKKTDERIEKLITKELEKMSADMFKELPWESPAYEKAISKVLSREKLSTADREKLHRQIKAFFARNLYFSLSNMPCAGTIEPHLLIEVFSDHIKSMVSSYAELWYFLYKHPSASIEFESYMREKNFQLWTRGGRLNNRN